MGEDEDEEEVSSEPREVDGDFTTSWSSVDGGKDSHKEMLATTCLK